MIELWAVAFRRAGGEESRFPSQSYVANTYKRILQDAAADEELATAALKLAWNVPDLLVQWANAVPAALVDREMPSVLVSQAAAPARQVLFQIWVKRGSKERVEKFIRENFALGLAF